MPFKHGKFVPPPQPDMTPPILRKAEWMLSKEHFARIVEQQSRDAIPDDLMALAAIAVSITDRRVVFSDCTEVESLEEAANNLTPETRELIEDWKARK